MNHIVFYSSGTASWLAAMRVAQKHGAKNLYLVFADTGIEDEDNYRFLKESAEIVGGELVWLRDEQKRTPWDIYIETGWLSHRQGEKGCSHQLKTKVCRNWIEENSFNPDETILHFGISLNEIERLGKIAKNWQPYKVEAPLCWDDFGWATHLDVENALVKHNLRRPRLYDYGFAHANCGGFCVKAGQKHFYRLLKHFPNRYLEQEKREKEWQATHQKENTVLRTQINSKTVPLTLEKWRELCQPIVDAEAQQSSFFDLPEFIDSQAEGGCGCFIS